MPLAKIAFVGLLGSGDSPEWARWQDYLAQLAWGVVEAMPGGCAIELLSLGKMARREVLRPGVERRTLPAAVDARDPLEAISWEYPAALAGADLVHIHEHFSRSSELAVLLAKRNRQMICVTEHRVTHNSLFAELELSKLADAVIYYDRPPSVARRVGQAVEVIPGEFDLAAFDSRFAVGGEGATAPQPPTAEQARQTGSRLARLYQKLLADVACEAA